MSICSLQCAFSDFVRNLQSFRSDSLEHVIQGGDQAFGDLDERYLDEVQRYIYYRVANRFNAEDLTEVVFLKVWDAFPWFVYPPM